jgi:hypothetical protein
MKQRTLLEEIKRIHEISGIKMEFLSEELINEGPVEKEMARIVTSFFTNIEKEILIGTKKYTLTQAQKIVGKIGSKTLTTDEITVIKALTKQAIAADRAIITNLTSDIFGELQKLQGRTLRTKYFSEVKAAMKNILPDDEVKNVVNGVKTKINATVTPKPNTGTSTGTSTPPSTTGTIPNFNIPNLNTTVLNQAWKMDVAATRAAIKGQFPKASSRDIEIMVQGLSKTKDQATFDIAIKDAVENFKPTYAANLNKPGNMEIIRKRWNLLPGWGKWLVGLSTTIVGYRTLKAAGVPIDDFGGWFTGGVKEIGADQFNSTKDELKKGFKKPNDANSSGINPAKDSTIVEPNNTEDPLGLLQNKGGGN